jgi:hypothetical protein
MDSTRMLESALIIDACTFKVETAKYAEILFTKPVKYYIL